MFGLLICLAAGIHPIITFSSDEKLDITRNLGCREAVEMISYNEHPNWEEEALRLTNGRDVDVFFENVGVSTVAKRLASWVLKGTVSWIGSMFINIPTPSALCR